MPCGACSVGSGRSIGIESRVPFSSLWSLRLAPSWSSPNGTPAASVRTERFAPFWLYQWDSGPVLGPPSGALVIAPSADKNDQSIPTTSSYSNSPRRQISWNTPACSHS